MTNNAETAEKDATAALREFVQWVATQRAYNGSDHPHAQSLYNECLNAVLPTWAEEFIATRVTPPGSTCGYRGCPLPALHSEPHVFPPAVRIDWQNPIQQEGGGVTYEPRPVPPDGTDEDNPIIHRPGCSWETTPYCDCGADPERVTPPAEGGNVD